MIRLFSGAICAAIVGALAPIAIASASAEPLKLSEVLGSTHVHGLAVDASDSSTLLIATHHGLFALDRASGMVEPISKAASSSNRVKVSRCSCSASLAISLSTLIKFSP